MKIEEVVKAYRDEHGLSQREFAKKAGLSSTYIWYLEQGRNPQTGRPINPSLPALIKISNAMGVSLDELMGQCGNLLVALSDKDDDKEVFLALFAKLSAAQREAVLSVMKGMIEE